LLSPRARKHDVSADREPEGVIAHDWYLDKHAKYRGDYHKERSNKAKVHCAYLLGLQQQLKILPHDHTAKCKILSQAQGNDSA